MLLANPLAAASYMPNVIFFALASKASLNMPGNAKTLLI